MSVSATRNDRTTQNRITQNRALEQAQEAARAKKVEEKPDALASAQAQPEVKNLAQPEAPKEKASLQARAEARDRHALTNQTNRAQVHRDLNADKLALKPGETSSVTERALQKDASLEARQAAAQQFTEGRTLSNSMPWNSRDTEVSGSDVRQANALHTAESLRKDTDPAVKRQLERSLIQGIDDSKDPAFKTALAKSIADNPLASVPARAEAFRRETELRGLRGRDAGIEKSIQLGQETAARLEQFRSQPLTPTDRFSLAPMRADALAQMRYAAQQPGVTAAQKAQLADLTKTIARNLPTDPAERAAVEKLASGEIPIDSLSYNDTERAAALLKRYPPTAFQEHPPLGDPDAARTQGHARLDANEKVQDRLQRLEKLYQANGWTRDSDIQPGTEKAPNPAGDQALLASIAERARARGAENGRKDQALTNQDFSAISYRDTLKGLQATQNIRAANPEIFKDPPPTDPEKLQTRERVNTLERHLRRNADIQALTTRVDGLNSTFDRMLKERGVVGRFADGFKNNLGVKDGWIVDSNMGSDAVTGSLGDVAKARRALDDMRNFKGNDKAFAAEMETRKKALTDALTKTQGHVQDWAKSQSQWVDTVSDIAAVTAGVVGAAAAPFTLGGSLVLGGALGAATKVGLKGLDAATGSGIYDGKLLGDLGKGFFAGASGVGAAQISKILGGHLATKFGGSLAARAGAFTAAESTAGLIDGAAVGTVNTLIDGGSFTDALKNGLKGGAIGALLGPLVGGGVAGTGQLVKAIRAGKPMPNQVPFNSSRELSLAHLERAGFKASDLGGDLKVRGLEPGQSPYVMRSADGTIEMGLPIQKDGTVLARDIGHEAEHLRQLAQMNTNPTPELAADIANAHRSASRMQRLRTELKLARSPEQRARIERDLRSVEKAYRNNPVELQARAAGFEAEARALEQAGRPYRASASRRRAERLRAKVPKSRQASADPTKTIPKQLRLLDAKGDSEFLSDWVRNAKTPGDVKEALNYAGELKDFPAGMRKTLDDEVNAWTKQHGVRLKEQVEALEKTRRASGRLPSSSLGPAEQLTREVAELRGLGRARGLTDADLFGKEPGFKLDEPVPTRTATHVTRPATDYVDAAALRHGRDFNVENSPVGWASENGDFGNKGAHYHVRQDGLDIEAKVWGTRREDGGIDLNFDIHRTAGLDRATAQQKAGATGALAQRIETDAAFRGRFRTHLTEALRSNVPQNTRDGARALLNYLEDLDGLERTVFGG